MREKDVGVALKMLEERGIRGEPVEVEKNNGVIFKGLQLGGKYDNMRPIVYFTDGGSVESFVKACEQALELSNDDWKEAVNKFKYYDFAKKYLTLRLSSKPTKDLVKVTAFCDLFKTAGVDIGNNGYIQIKEKILQIWNISKDQLFEDALENSKKIEPPAIYGLSELIMKLLQDEENDIPNIPMYVITNRSMVFGASAILYAYDLLPDRFIMLPSSVHETIIIKDNIDWILNAGGLNELVRSVNSSKVSPEEVLSDNAYLFRNGEWSII